MGRHVAQSAAILPQSPNHQNLHSITVGPPADRWHTVAKVYSINWPYDLCHTQAIWFTCMIFSTADLQSTKTNPQILLTVDASCMYWLKRKTFCNHSSSLLIHYSMSTIHHKRQVLVGHHVKQTATLLPHVIKPSRPILHHLISADSVLSQKLAGSTDSLAQTIQGLCDSCKQFCQLHQHSSLQTWHDRRLLQFINCCNCFSHESSCL